MQASESNAYSDNESEPEKGNDRGKKIIDADPNAIVATTKIQKEEPEDSEEEECLFHSQMWVKGSPLQREPKEHDFSKGCEAVGFGNHSTPTAIHHRVASPRMRSLCYLPVSPSLQHQALHR